MLVQACARSHFESPALGPECEAGAEALSKDIVTEEGLEKSVSRQPELYAYVHNRLGAIVGLARQGGAYRAFLDNGTSFVSNFEQPAAPSAGDLKTLAACGRLKEMKEPSPAEAREAFQLCPSPDILLSRGVQPLDVGALDDARHYAVVRRCDRGGCATKLAPLDGQTNEWLEIRHGDHEPVPAWGSVSRVAASGNTLVYAVCEQASAINCHVTVKVYRLSEDGRSAQLVGEPARKFRHHNHGRHRG